MGHERLGILPRTKVWQIIIGEMAGFAAGKYDITEIAKNTLFNVRKQFINLENDPAIKASFEFLLKLSHAFQKQNSIEYLIENGVLDTEELNLIKLGSAVKKYKAEEVRSKEYQTFAKQATIDAINSWYIANIERGKSLFQEEIDSKAIFYKSSSGDGFCEISRLFFANLTERYLKYFLEREASTVIKNVKERNRFSEEIENHINDISKHAFETSKITESYSAGWFNKNVKEFYPEEHKIRGFLSYAFEKMRTELLREEAN
jgi:hypothetical protein